MHGSWHLLAISALVAILTSIIHSFVVIPYLLWIFVLYIKKRMKNKQVLLMFLICVFFFFLYESSENTNEIVEPFTEPVNLVGKVTSEVIETSTKLEFTVRENQGLKTQITYFKNQAIHNPAVKTGAICLINGLKRLPPESRNPGQFDYRDYLKKQGISYQLTVNNIRSINCTGSSQANTVFQWRKQLLSMTEDRLSRYTSSWLHALVLGDDSKLMEEDITLFQRWNLSHLLAISGLHVGLLAAILYYLIVKLQLMTKEKAQMTLILLLMLYPLLSGGAPSVWRASLMTVFGLILLLFKQKMVLTDIISAVFLLFLFIDHKSIYHIGFQFSFLVTFSLLLSRNNLSIQQSKIFIMLKISVISLLAILPLQVNYFFSFNPISVFLNLLFVPYFSVFVIPFLFFLFLLSISIPVPLSVLDQSFVFIHHSAIDLVKFVDHVMYFPWIIGEFPIIMLVPYYIMFILFLSQLDKGFNISSFRYGVILVGLLLGISMQPFLSPQGTITMLDVGQGDCIVIELPYRRGIIVMDAAGTMSNDFTTPSEKLYEQVIKPYLHSRGISHIDALILSHADHDHIGSVPFLLEDFTLDQLVVSQTFRLPSSMYSNLPSESFEVIQLEMGEKLSIGKQFFYAVSPKASIGTKQSSNNNSLVLYTKIGGLSWLFSGDIGEEVEQNIVKSYPHLSFDVLKVAHHGSKSSTSAAFLKATHPTIALISVGKKNRYGHPSKVVLNRLRQHEVEVLRTDNRGAIQYKFTNENGTFSSKLP